MDKTVPLESGLTIVHTISKTKYIVNLNTGTHGTVQLHWCQGGSNWTFAISRVLREWVYIDPITEKHFKLARPTYHFWEQLESKV